MFSLRVLSFCLLFALAFPTFGQHEVNNYRKMGTTDGLSNNSISCILKDSRGFMWFGTYDGLNRFDGYTFINYTKGLLPTNIPDSRITTLCEDKQGRIWIGTSQSGVVCFDYTQEIFLRAEQFCENSLELPGGIVNDIFLDSGGVVWIATNEGLCMYNEHTRTFKRIDIGSSPLGKQRAKVVVENPDGTIWGATNQRLFTLSSNKTKAEYIDISEKKKNIEIVELLFGTDSTLWVATQNDGLYYYNTRSKTIQHFSAQNGMLPHSSVLCIEKDGNNLWIGTDGGGLCILNTSTFKVHQQLHDETDPNSLSSNSVFSIYADEEGTFWLGTVRGGLNLWNGLQNKFEHVKRNTKLASTLAHNNVLSFFEDKDNAIWIGTDGGGMNKYTPNKQAFELYSKTTKRQISDNVIIDIEQDADGFLWLASYFGGLDKFSPPTGLVKNYNFHKQGKSHLPAQHLFTLEFQNDTILWIGSSGDGLIRFNTKTETYKHFVLDNQKPTNSVSSVRIPDVLIDSKSRIWIVTYGGGLNLYSEATGEFEHFRADLKQTDALQSDFLYQIHEDANGKLWVGTQDGGLALFNLEEKTFRSFTTTDGLPNNTILAIEEDSQNNLWLSTNNGICKFNTLTNETKNFTQSDGLQNKQFSYKASLLTKRGEIYFGGINGFNVFEPEKLKQNEVQPTTVITDFKLYNQSVKAMQEVGGRVILSKSILSTDTIQVMHSENALTFEFAALQYTNPEENLYAYQLLGFDKTWLQTNSLRRYASYTNLDPGNYTFMVKSANSDGAWSDKATTVFIKVVPPIWKTLWFRILAAVMFLSSGIVFYLYRITTIKKQKRQLEQVVQERTDDLQEVNSQLEERHEMLQIINTELSQQKEEIQSQKEELQVTLEEVQKHKEKIEMQNEFIKDSIRYAHTIQQAMLPDSKATNDFESFVIYKPKSIVSGDFFWFHKSTGARAGTRWFAAVVDCTGHGVPGGFMSMIGQRFLSEIVVESGCVETDEILTRLDEGVKRALNQRETDNMDGMDVAFCRIDLLDNGELEVQYTGAKRPLFVFCKEKQAVEQYKGDRKPVGGKYYEKVNFTNTILRLQQGDMLYLTTDGLIDQNSPERKRFGTPRFVELLRTIGNKDIAHQYEIIDDIAENFRRSEEQRDDITIWGMKL